MDEFISYLVYLSREARGLAANTEKIAAGLEAGDDSRALYARIPSLNATSSADGLSLAGGLPTKSSEGWRPEGCVKLAQGGKPSPALNDALGLFTPVNRSAAAVGVGRIGWVPRPLSFPTPMSCQSLLSQRTAANRPAGAACHPVGAACPEPFRRFAARTPREARKQPHRTRWCSMAATSLKRLARQRPASRWAR